MVYRYEVKVREPYMGNQIVLAIHLVIEDGQPRILTVTNEEGIYHNAKLVAENSDGRHK